MLAPERVWHPSCTGENAEIKMQPQRTTKTRVTCQGVGLHTGRKVRLALSPAPADTGILFKRVDLPGQPVISASCRHVVATHFATTLGYNGFQIATVEHLLAAAYGLRIDNLTIEIDSSEVPIMDGSAADFVQLIRSAGVEELNKPVKVLRLLKPIRVSEGDREASLCPGEDFRLSLVIDFEHPRIGRQSYSLALSEEGFGREVSPARTFGFVRDVEKLLKNGLARGGSLGNTVVIGAEEVLNSGGLRFPDEFVRHKLLDCIGDLSLVGFPILGHYQAYKPGHSLNHRLIKKVLSDEGNYSLL